MNGIIISKAAPRQTQLAYHDYDPLTCTINSSFRQLSSAPTLLRDIGLTITPSTSPWIFMPENISMSIIVILFSFHNSFFVLLFVVKTFLSNIHTKMIQRWASQVWITWWRNEHDWTMWYIFTIWDQSQYESEWLESTDREGKRQGAKWRKGRERRMNGMNHGWMSGSQFEGREWFLSLILLSSSKSCPMKLMFGLMMGRQLLTTWYASITVMKLCLTRYPMAIVGEREIPAWQWIRTLLPLFRAVSDELNIWRNIREE